MRFLRDIAEKWVWFTAVTESRRIEHQLQAVMSVGWPTKSKSVQSIVTKSKLYSSVLCVHIQRAHHGASWCMRFQNPLDFTWISDFRLDFWISIWISGLQSGFLKWISTSKMSQVSTNMTWCFILMLTHLYNMSQWISTWLLIFDQTYKVIVMCTCILNQVCVSEI